MDPLCLPDKVHILGANNNPRMIGSFLVQCNEIAAVNCQECASLLGSIG